MLLLSVLLVFALFGRWIAKQKGRSKWEGAILGLLFGPFGCLIEAVLPTKIQRPKSASSRAYRSGPVEPGEMPEDWGRAKPEPDDGVDLGWLK